MFSSLFWYCPPKPENLCSDSKQPVTQSSNFDLLYSTPPLVLITAPEPLITDLHELMVYYNAMRHIKSHARLNLPKKKKSIQLWKARFVIPFITLLMDVGGEKKGKRKREQICFQARPTIRLNKKSTRCFEKKNQEPNSLHQGQGSNFLRAALSLLKNLKYSH